MTLAISRVEPVTRSWVELMAPAVELAKAIAGTDFVPRGLRGNPAAVAAAILYGDEIGVGPMQSLAQIAVIDGRPFIAAQTQRRRRIRRRACAMARRGDQRARYMGRPPQRRRRGDADYLDPRRRAPRPPRRQTELARLPARHAERPRERRASARDVRRRRRRPARDRRTRRIDPQLVGLPALAAAPADAAGVTGPAPAGRRSRTPRRPVAAVPSATVEGAASAAPAAAPRPRPPLRPPGADRADVEPVEVEQADLAPAQRRPQPAPDPYASPLITPAQRRRMMQLCTRLGMGGRSEDARALRLRLWTDWIGRPVGSSNELTSAEADRIVTQLEAMGEPVDDAVPPAGEAPVEVEQPALVEVEPVDEVPPL